MISPTNDEDEIDPKEIEDAADETPGGGEAPELIPRTENLTAWDDSPAESGRVSPRMPMEDEVSPAESLIDEGLDEADRHQRMAAVDPDLEP